MCMDSIVLTPLCPCTKTSRSESEIRFGPAVGGEESNFSSYQPIATPLHPSLSPNKNHLSHCDSSPLLQTMTLSPLFVRSVVRLVGLLVSRPAASVTTILYYSRVLPRNRSLERLVRDDLLDDENYLFHFLISMLRCFW
uniref:Uncharacterized protein LOC105052820 n=1 Tax=Elaeis guineensis var. tenera TaxID=51953 RepID=A0A6I9RUE7_ELAGV|nr:uncharacterized protein LOC105052820 [Elaeis guineensis]